MSTPARIRRRSRTVAVAAVWIVAGGGYLVLEAIAATGFRPSYSYAHNYISDLGATSHVILHGRLVDSPLADLMNFAFYLQGSFFFLGAVLLVGVVGHRKSRMFLTCAAMNAVGNILVGTVHSGATPEADGTPWLHGAGAALAILGGNVAVLAGSAILRNAGAASWYRTMSIGLAVLGLLSFAMLVIELTTAAMNVLPAGAWERGSVYSIIVWQMFTAVFLVRSARHTRSGV